MKKPMITDRMRLFKNEYMVDRNATQAAIRAGYSPKTAHEIGRQLLRHPLLAVELADAERTVAERLGISAETVLRERARLAFFDIGKLYGDDGQLLPLDKLDEDTRRAIKSIKYRKHAVRPDYEMADKGQSLAALERHLGLYKDEGGGEVGGLNIHIHL